VFFCRNKRGLLFCDISFRVLTPKGFGLGIEMLSQTRIAMANQIIIPIDAVQEQIYFIRGHKVMLSQDLAKLYEVNPKVLIQAVKRNLDRFPGDFMFQLSEVEFRSLRSQIVTLA
jgi:hypothetical protein